MIGMPGVRSRCVSLHRKVYCDHNGLQLSDIAGKVIRHTCDNPRCINPAHLVIGTRADNNRDRSERNRSAKQVPSRQRLTKEQCAFIISRYVPRDADYGGAALSRLFGVDRKVVYNVLKGTYVCTKYS